MKHEILKKRINICLLLFIVALVLSGITAFPLEWEAGILKKFTQEGTMLGNCFPDLSLWIGKVHEGILRTSYQYPFISYGTDWLAFAHILIAILFIGILKDPVKNIWVIQFGIIACLLVVPAAIIFGHIRGIPFFWQIIDCSFGIFGLMPLALAYKYTRQLTV